MATKTDYLKKAKSSLQLHTDAPGDIRGQLVGLGQGYNRKPSLVVCNVDGVLPTHPKGKAFGPIPDNMYATCGPAAHAVAAPPGSFIFWKDTVVHGNCGEGHTLPVLYDAELHYADAVMNPHKVHENLETFGVCVVSGIITKAEAEDLTQACITAVKETRQDPTNPFKGASGSSLWKFGGVSTHEDIRPFYTIPYVHELWAAVLFGDASRVDDLCVSPDCIAFSAPQRGIGDNINHPTRAALILCYGDRNKQEEGTGALKLAYYKQGGTCNHPPTQFTKGGRGSHYSNGGPIEKRYLTATPSWGKNSEVDALFARLLGP